MFAYVVGQKVFQSMYRGRRHGLFVGLEETQVEFGYLVAFFTFVAYIVLTFVLDPMPDNVVSGEQQPSSGELLDAVDRELAASEKRLREMERYVTSDTFSLRSRFRQL